MKNLTKINFKTFNGWGDTTGYYLGKKRAGLHEISYNLKGIRYTTLLNKIDFKAKVSKFK